MILLVIAHFMHIILAAMNTHANSTLSPNIGILSLGIMIKQERINSLYHSIYQDKEFLGNMVLTGSLDMLPPKV